MGGVKGKSAWVMVFLVRMAHKHWSPSISSSLWNKALCGKGHLPIPVTLLPNHYQSPFQINTVIIKKQTIERIHNHKDWIRETLILLWRRRRQHRPTLRLQTWMLRLMLSDSRLKKYPHKKSPAAFMLRILIVRSTQTPFPPSLIH